MRRSSRKFNARHRNITSHQRISLGIGATSEVRVINLKSDQEHSNCPGPTVIHGPVASEVMNLVTIFQ